MALRSLARRLGPRHLATSALAASVYGDSHLDALDRRKRSASHRSKEFDTLGTWDTRLNVQIDETAMLKTGHVVPDISVSMIGVATDTGRRTYQEDRHCVTQLRPDLLYLAVFDGHGGTLCADYCQEHFERHILHHLEREEDLLVVLDKSFHDVNRSFERWYMHRPEHLGRAGSSGSTATVCLVQDNYMLYLGHCGDSRAILCRDGQARTLTKDHCASDPQEAARIKESGGRVLTDSIGRTLVNSQLAMSRSIGDLELKNYGVTARPELRRVRLKHGKDQFLALTSDGINWVMQDQEVRGQWRMIHIGLQI
jgi:protein phosphatase 1K